MILALRGDTSRHDAGRSLYGRSKARLPTGHASWPTRRGTCPIMVLTARSGRWLLPTSWPAWRAYNVCLPDTCRRYRVDAPDGISVPEWRCYTDSGRRTRLGFLSCCEAGRLVRHESRRQAMARVVANRGRGLDGDQLSLGTNFHCWPKPAIPS